MADTFPVDVALALGVDVDVVLQQEAIDWHQSMYWIAASACCMALEHKKTTLAGTTWRKRMTGRAAAPVRFFGHLDFVHRHV